MAELKCLAEKCVYNKDYLCSNGDIMGGRKHADSIDDTCCESFMERRQDREAYTSSTSHPSNYISIDCEATRCIYNQNYKCVAERVDIRGVDAEKSMETACATFTDKH